MPEGHIVHRNANDFNRYFAGAPLEITSPQGRFSESAKLVSGRKLVRAKAVGKQLFLRFDNDLVLRIHLGIYGKWAFREVSPENHPEPIGQVRARFSNLSWLADLRGPTVCEVITRQEARKIVQKLGPDPLNADPHGVERDRFIERANSSKAAIGLLLMNQDVIAGIGNVYRAEILFRAGIDPHRPANQLTKDELTEIWRDSVELLKIGVKTGFMITRDELRTKKPNKSERNFIYKREGLPCRVCGTNISIEMMAGRKLYFCAGCQK